MAIYPVSTAPQSEITNDVNVSSKVPAGGDPSKIALLKNSIEEGYKSAEKAWGGELPEISKQTLQATLKGLDDWAKEQVEGCLKVVKKQKRRHESL